MNFKDILNKFKKYAELEGTEYGEYCRALINIYQHGNFLSDELSKSLKQSITKELEYFEESFNIVKTTKTITQTFDVLEEK